MSVTALPVMARILQDIGMLRTEVGALALTCALVGDATAWCLLALVVALTVVSSVMGRAVVVLTAGFALLLVGVVRPALLAWIGTSAGASRPARCRSCWSRCCSPRGDGGNRHARDFRRVPARAGLPPGDAGPQGCGTGFRG